MTIYLDVIASATTDEPMPYVEIATEPERPAVFASPSGVFLIHVAPSPRLDPSTDKLEKVTIDDDLDEAHLKTFIVD